MSRTCDFRTSCVAMDDVPLAVESGVCTDASHNATDYIQLQDRRPTLSSLPKLPTLLSADV